MFVIAVIIIIGLVASGALLFFLALPEMWNFLVVSQPPRHADVIIVLSGDTGRAEYGIQLYQEGYADTMLFAGGAAQSMRREAIDMGVPEDHILLDRRSHSTFENAENSASIMQEQGLTTAILVTSAYHTRRAGIIFSGFIPEADLTVCAVPTTTTGKDWWRNSRTADYVILEYLKLVWHYLFER